MTAAACAAPKFPDAATAPRRPQKPTPTPGGVGQEDTRMQEWLRKTMQRAFRYNLTTLADVAGVCSMGTAALVYRETLLMNMAACLLLSPTHKRAHTTGSEEGPDRGLSRLPRPAYDWHHAGAVLSAVALALSQQGEGGDGEAVEVLLAHRLGHQRHRSTWVVVIAASAQGCRRQVPMRHPATLAIQQQRDPVACIHQGPFRY